MYTLYTISLVLSTACVLSTVLTKGSHVKATQTHDKEIPEWLKEDLLYDLESDIKYEGYIKRHKKEIATLKKSEHLKISPELTFSSVPGISKEAEEKLELVKPENLGQARRVSGVTPADVSALHVFLSK